MGGGGGVAILGLKNKGGFQNLQDSGGLDFEEGKALFWHWIIPIFLTCSGPCYLDLTVHFQKIHLQHASTPFSKINIM